MKNIYPIFATFLLSVMITPTSVNAFEVTYLEFDILGDLKITITTKSSIPECRVMFNGKPIGSGSGVARAGVATVRVSIPSGLRDKSSEFTYFCTG